MKKRKDPKLFEGVSKHCVPVDSDDVELQHCPFTHEYSDNSPISSPSLTLTTAPATQHPTPIIMLSLPSTTDSVTQSTPHEQFETPPENNNSSQPYFSGSDDPKPTDTVDLANDSEIGFTNRGYFQEEMRKKVRVSEEDLDEKERLVIEIDQTQEVDTEMVVEYEENLDLEADEQNIQRHSDSDSESSNLKISEKCHEEGDGGEVHEVDGSEKLKGVVGGGGGRDVESMDVSENEKLKAVVGGDGGRGVESMNVSENEKLKGFLGGDGGRGVESTNIDENVKSNGVGVKEMQPNGLVESANVGGASGNVEGSRELPASMRGTDKDIGLMEAIGKAASTGKFKDLMEVASKMLGSVNADENNGDFFETAIKRGVTFPRPRWWPPEGFDD